MKVKSTTARNVHSADEALANKLGRSGSIESFIRFLAHRTKKRATIEEINEAAAAGWSGEVSFDEDVGSL